MTLTKQYLLSSSFIALSLYGNALYGNDEELKNTKEMNKVLLQLLQERPPSAAGPQQPSINLHLGGAHAEANASNKSVQRVLQDTTVEHRFKLDFGIVSTIKDTYHDTAQTSARCFNACSAFASGAKWHIGGALFIATYSALSYKIYQAHKLISMQDSWCNWKEVVPLQHLLLSSEKDLINQLSISIQKKYFLLPFVTLDHYSYMIMLQEIKAEQVALQQYETILQAASSFYCSRFFYFSIDKATIDERLARLSFILDLLIKWQMQQSQAQ